MNNDDRLKNLNSILDIESILGNGELTKESKLHNLLKKMYQTRSSVKLLPPKLPYYWEADFFKFQNNSLYLSVSNSNQTDILSALSQHNLSESYYIEQLGFTFNAKLVLLSETLEEKCLYSMFASDEAIHLDFIKHFIPKIPNATYKVNPFLQVIANIVNEGDQRTLVFLIQILLEGFGIIHYSSLAQNSNDENLKNAFNKILADEANHHGSGQIIFKNILLEEKSKIDIMNFSQQILELFKFWAHPILGAFHQSLGDLSKDEATKILEDIKFTEQSLQKMNFFKSEFKHQSLDGILFFLEEKKLFSPVSIKECVDMYFAQGY